MRIESVNIFVSFFLAVLVIVNINIAFTNHEILVERKEIFNDLHEALVLRNIDRYTTKDAAKDKAEMIALIKESK